MQPICLFNCLWMLLITVILFSFLFCFLCYMCLFRSQTFCHVTFTLSLTLTTVLVAVAHCLADAATAAAVLLSGASIRSVEFFLQFCFVLLKVYGVFFLFVASLNLAVYLSVCCISLLSVCHLAICLPTTFTAKKNFKCCTLDNNVGWW